VDLKILTNKRDKRLNTLDIRIMVVISSLTKVKASTIDRCKANLTTTSRCLRINIKLNKCMAINTIRVPISSNNHNLTRDIPNSIINRHKVITIIRCFLQLMQY
jgi:hypothetical protein